MALGLLKQKRLNYSLGLLLAVGAFLAVFLYFFHSAGAWTGNNGVAAWGQGTGTGQLRFSDYTFGSPGTFGTSFRNSTAPSASAIQFVVNKAAPTRTEKLLGYQLNNGDLFVAKCSSNCSGVSNITTSLWSWGTPAIVGTNVRTRAFDIAYEQLSGRAMVVYAGNTTGKLYYCIYDGSTWGPVSSCTPTNGQNDISLTDGTTTLTGIPTWVSLVPYGSQFGDQRSNDILMAVEDSNNNILVEHWNGSSWVSSDRQVLTTTGGATVSTTEGTSSPPWYDIGWETDSQTEMVVYANGTALNYRTSTGSGWSAASTITTLSTAAQWIKIASDPISNRMSLIVSFGSTSTGGTATATPYIWKSDGTTVGWGSALTSVTMDQNGGQNVSTVWEKAHGGTPQAIFSSGNNSSTQVPTWASWTQSGGLSSWTSLATNSGDVITSNELTASPNSDIINMMQTDRDGRLDARSYSGSAWGSLIAANGTQLPTTSNNTFTGRTTNQTYIQKPYQFTYFPYSPWSENWQAFDSTGNSSLANQDTEPTVPSSDIIHLRVNIAELGGQSETTDTNGVRKKLQFSSGAGCPDSITCTWTDVAASGTTSTAWRYSTSGGTTDATTITSLKLSGSDTLGLNYTNGTASVSGAVQNTGTTEEYDYTIQNYSATAGTDYYFRVYNYGASTSGGSMVNLGPIYREQIVNTSGTQNTDCTDGVSNINCTYPTLFAYSSAPNPPVFQSVPNGTTTPAIQLNAVDILGNGLQYVVEWCPTNSWPCAAGGGSFDETASQTGWSGQDITCNSLPCYTGAATIAGSSIATYTVPGGIFQPNSTYYLRAKAIDPPPGLNAFGLYSTTASFSTGALSIKISGGSCIGNKIVSNVITPCGPTAHTSIGSVKIGN